MSARVMSGFSIATVAVIRSDLGNRLRYIVGDWLSNRH